MIEIRCNLCGSPYFENRYVNTADEERYVQEYRISDERTCPPSRVVRCVACGLVYVPLSSDREKLQQCYRRMEDPPYVAEEQGRRQTARRIVAKLNPFRQFGNRLLEIGCSTGFFLEEARCAGWQVQGLDLSSWAASYAREHFGIDVMNVTLAEAAFPRAHFDVVVMQDTIEHLLAPKETLEEIRRILKPTGVVYLNTPDIDSLASRILGARWWGINNFHVFYFSRATLGRMLKAAGFQPLGWSSYARTFSMNYLMQRARHYHTCLSVLVRAVAFLIGRSRLMTINCFDQIEVIARRSRALAYLDEMESEPSPRAMSQPRVVVVLPAYNAAATLVATCAAIPRESVSEIILVDDCSTDATVAVAQSLGITVVKHERNRGYGGNQKTCYDTALAHRADIVIMVHPDYQYDPRVIPDLIEPIRQGRADAVFGSRMLKGGALVGGMPVWKHNVNILLTALANVVLRTYLTEYHSGFRAYSARFLRAVRYQENVDSFVFDFEIIVQALFHFFRIEEVPIRTRYFDEASTIRFLPAVCYGLGILKTLIKAWLHRRRWVKFRKFE